MDASSEKGKAFFEYQERSPNVHHSGGNQEIDENACASESEGEVHALSVKCVEKRVFISSSFIESMSDALETRTALIYDGVMILAEAIKQLGTEQIQPHEIYCNVTDSVWPTGFTLTNYIKSVFCLSVERE